ncbi:hypothetical protein [Streptosporangium sp. OZ121]|uniref:hypothetical protein n=1 Tax=Streptosporangium sp. OZ121 TaxID=3444183 RepID=UPI003F79016B
MHPTRSTRPQRVIAAIKPVLAILGGLTMLYVCVTQLYFETFEVDPAAVSEVRDIGKVLAHTKQEFYYDGTTHVDDFLLMDVGSSNFDEARARARGHLQNRGWKATEGGYRSIRMESAKWEHTVLRIDSLESYDAYGDPLDSQTKKKISEDPGKQKSYLIMSLTQTG